jgi:hypothetical protein
MHEPIFRCQVRRHVARAAGRRLNPRIAAGDFQVWTLTVTVEHSGVLTCDDGNGNAVYTQQIEYTDSPTIRSRCPAHTDDFATPPPAGQPTARGMMHSPTIRLAAPPAAAPALTLAGIAYYQGYGSAADR